MEKYIFSADIGGMSVKLGLFNTNGDLQDNWAIETRTVDNGASILPDITQSIFDKMAERSIKREDVEGVGVIAPGPVLEDGTIRGAVNLGWGTFNLKEKLERLTVFRCEAANDANAAALGELWKGGGAGYSDIMMVTLGTGIGGGLIIDGKIRAGANGSAAEIGHIPLFEPEDEPDVCGCGKRGCLEQYASARGVLRTAKRYLNEHPDKPCALRDKEGFSSRDLFDLVKEGDKTACEIAEIIYRYLGRGTATIAAVCDVEAFVIGGGMSAAGQILIDGIQKYYVKYAFPATRDIAFRLATLGNKAGIYGAAKLLIG